MSLPMKRPNTQIRARAMNGTGVLSYLKRQTKFALFNIREHIYWLTRRDFESATVERNGVRIGILARAETIADISQILGVNEITRNLTNLARKTNFPNSQLFDSCDLVFVELHPWHLRANSFDFAFQPLVEQEISLDTDFESYFHRIDRSQRPRFKESINKGDFVTFSSDPEDIKSFYDDFLIPTASLRHGKRAFVPPLDYFLRNASLNCLLQLRNSSGQVELMIFILKKKPGSTWRLFRTGFNHNLELDNRRRGVLKARAYGEVCRYAIEFKIKKLSLGLSPASAAHGIFRFKSDFGAEALAVPFPFTQVAVANFSDNGALELMKLKLLFSESRHLRTLKVYGQLKENDRKNSTTTIDQKTISSSL